MSWFRRKLFEIQVFVSGDSAIEVMFGDEISPDILGKVQAFTRKIAMLKTDGIVEVVPSYARVTVFYDPFKIEANALVAILKTIAMRTKPRSLANAKTVRIPVLYGGEFGEDLSVVTSHTGLTEEEVIAKHTAPSYLVYMLGFTPGFCYLGGLSDQLKTPRRENPRSKILAGSVGIAGAQTGVYPIESPGGWQIIGRTPLNIFDPERKKPFLLEAGNRLEFYAISQQVYHQLNEHNDG